MKTGSEISSITNLRFLVFPPQLLPDQYKKKTFGKEILIFVVLLEVIFLVVSQGMQTGEKLTTIKDVVVIAYIFIIVAGVDCQNVVGIIVLGVVVSVITLLFNQLQTYLLRWRQLSLKLKLKQDQAKCILFGICMGKGV